MKPYTYVYADGSSRPFYKCRIADLFVGPGKKIIKFSINRLDSPNSKEVHYNLVKEFNTKSSLRPNRVRDAQRKAAKLFQRFMTKLAEDMIEDHVIFLIPMPNGGYMYIADLNKMGKPGRKKHMKVNTKGAYYVPILHRGTRLKHTKAYFYTVRFNMKNRNRLLKKVLEGEKYI